MRNDKRPIWSRNDPQQPSAAPGFCSARAPSTGTSRSTKDYGMSRWGRRSVRFGTGELDHLGPLLCLVRDELAEVRGRKRMHRAAQFGDPRPQLRIDESCIDLLVELLDDL